MGSSTSYAAQTEQNRIRTIREPAIRGSIVDRNGNVLVQNTLVDTITVKRGLTEEEEAADEALAAEASAESAAEAEGAAPPEADEE